MATKSKEKSATSKSRVKDEPTPAGNLPFALQRLDKLLGGASNSIVTLTDIEGKTLVSVQSSNGVAEVPLDAPIAGLDASWDFPFQTLSAALQGKTNAKLACTAGQLSIKDKSYLANLQGSESKAMLRVEKPSEPTASITVSSDIWAMLSEMTGKVKVSKSLAAMPDITVHYLFTEKTALAVAFDRFQLAAYFVPNNFGVTFSLTLPLPKAEALFKNNSGVTKLLASDALLYVKAGSLSFSTSLPSVEDTTGVSVDAVLPRVKAVRQTNPAKAVVIPKSSIQQFLENARAVSGANALLTVEVADSSSKLTLAADGNKVSSIVPSKSKKPFQFKLDIGYVNTIVAKAAENVQLEIDDSVLLFRTDTLVYASMLSVDDNADDEAPAKKKKAPDDEE